MKITTHNRQVGARNHRGPGDGVGDPGELTVGDRHARAVHRENAIAGNGIGAHWGSLKPIPQIVKVTVGNAHVGHPPISAQTGARVGSHGLSRIGRRGFRPADWSKLQTGKINVTDAAAGEKSHNVVAAVIVRQNGPSAAPVACAIAVVGDRIRRRTAPTQSDPAHGRLRRWIGCRQHIRHSTFEKHRVAGIQRGAASHPGGQRVAGAMLPCRRSVRAGIGVRPTGIIHVIADSSALGCGGD